MKKIKKNLFGIGLALAMIMGIGFSFVPQDVNAEAIFGGGKIPCWSSYDTGSGGFVFCATCADHDGTPTGGSGKCKPNHN
jgi:hypothetical protein